jgi:hypothetical protein
MEEYMRRYNPADMPEDYRVVVQRRMTSLL